MALTLLPVPRERSVGPSCTMPGGRCLVSTVYPPELEVFMDVFLPKDPGVSRYLRARKGTWSSK